MTASSSRPVASPSVCLSTVAWCLLWGTVLQHCPVSSQCTLPSGLQDVWYRASDGAAINLTTTGLEGHRLQVGSTPYHRFLCAQSHEDRIFIFSLEERVDGVVGKVMGYFCWQLTPITPTTFLLYQRTPVASSGSFAADRAVSSDGAVDTVPPLTSVCALDPASLHPTVLYRVSSDATSDVNVTSINMAEQQCPSQLLANYTYIKNDTGCAGKDSRLDFCVDRKTARVNYNSCNESVLFSETGVLSCVASFTMQSTIYVMLVNHDDSVDDVNYFRFACLKVEREGESATAVVYPRDCTAARGTHTLTLKQTASCDSDSEENIIPLTVGLTLGIFVIIVIVVVIIVVCKRFSKKRMTKIHPNSIPRENVPKPPGKVSTDIKVNITELTISSTGNNPMCPDECVVGGRLPPLAQDFAKLAPLRA